MTAVRNKHHSVSVSSVEAESFLNLDAMLSANAVRTSLSANLLPFDSISFSWSKSLSFSQGFQDCQSADN